MDYTAHNDVGARLAELGPFAAAIDTLGVGKLYAGCARFISPGGVYESVGIKPPGFSVPNFFCAVLAMKANEYWPVSLALGGTGRRWGACSMMNPTTADRQAVMDLLESGLRVTVNKVFDMDEAREAYRYLAEGHASGKVLVKVAASSK